MAILEFTAIRAVFELLKQTRISGSCLVEVIRQTHMLDASCINRQTLRDCHRDGEIFLSMLKRSTPMVDTRRAQSAAMTPTVTLRIERTDTIACLGKQARINSKVCFSSRDLGRMDSAVSPKMVLWATGLMVGTTTTPHLRTY